MRKFKVGDKVRCVVQYARLVKHGIYTVTDKQSYDLPEIIRLKEVVGGWDMSRFELVLSQVDTTEFQVGDIVEAFGVIGRVSGIKHEGYFTTEPDYKIQVTSGNNEFTRFDYYSIDGKADVWHKIPSLKLIERPLPKEISFEANVIDGDSFDDYIESEKLNPYVNKKVSVTIKVLEDK